MKKNIILAGPRGKMGTAALNMIKNDDEFTLVACIDRKNNGKTLKEIGCELDLDVPIFENSEECFDKVEADVFLDLTVPEVGFEHTKTALEHQMRTVVGTSGFTNTQIDQLQEIAKANEVGCIIAPNFAVGAVLMMQFAQKAAKFLPDVEIIEKHHDQKVDAPSGTALKTVDLIQAVRKPKRQGHKDETETLEGARGGEVDGIHIHSVRLPGLVAHQEVILGGAGQTLTITHDSLSRESFMDGIKLSIQHVIQLKELVYGLENILDDM